MSKYVCFASRRLVCRNKTSNSSKCEADILVGMIGLDEPQTGPVAVVAGSFCDECKEFLLQSFILAHDMGRNSVRQRLISELRRPEFCIQSTI